VDKIWDPAMRRIITKMLLTNPQQRADYDHIFGAIMDGDSAED